MGEKVSEDYCFVCKDGGLLIVCDHKQCYKAYHPECVGKDVTFLETEEPWTCNWHTCFICHKKSTFHCFCCTLAVCRSCIKSAEFVIIRGKNGFCNDCLKLALLIEQNEEVDSDGGKVDFKDKETYECLFVEYWKRVNEKECLTLETLHMADIQLKKGKQCLSPCVMESEQNCTVISSDSEHVKGKIVDRKYQCQEEPNRWQFTMKMMKSESKSKKQQSVGWGSRPLIEFLASIGIDTSKQLSRLEVNSFITAYINKNNLTHPIRQGKVICDTQLHSIFGKRSINRNKIPGLLRQHLLENQEQPVEDKFRRTLEDEGEDDSGPCKRQMVSSSGRRTHKKKKVFEVPQSCFASITPRNIKLVYLKRSLVENLLKTTETFEEKVVGSFVRIKSDQSDCLQRNSHQLLQVTGIKKALGTDNLSLEIVLQVSHVKKEISIQMLSDDDFPDEECDDLRQRVRDGLIKRPTIVEFEQKAWVLHEDITKHWISKELALLQNLIDRANEKGWRRDLSEYLERKQVLQKPSEQLRLLKDIPLVIADEVEFEASPRDFSLVGKEREDGLPRSTLNDDLAGDMKTSTQMVGEIFVAGDGSAYGREPENAAEERGKEKGEAVTLGLGRQSKNSICRFTQGSKGMSAGSGNGDVPSPKHSSSSPLDEGVGLSKIMHPLKQRSFKCLDSAEVEEVHLDVMPKHSQWCHGTILAGVRTHLSNQAHHGEDSQPSSATTTSASMEMKNHVLSPPKMAGGVPLRFPPGCDVFIPGYPGWTVPIYETGVEVEIPRPPSVPGIPLPKDIEWFPRHRVEDLMSMVAGLKDMVRCYSHDILVMRNTINELRTSKCSSREGNTEEATS